MKTVIQKDSALAVYLFSDGDDISITDRGLYGPVRALDIKPETHQIINDVPAPDLWIGGALAYDNGWTIVNQDAITEKLDGLKQVKQAQRVTALEAAREGGFSHSGHTVASDEKSQTLLTALNTEAALALLQGTQEALDAFASGLGNGWRAIDGTVVATDAAGFRAMMQSWYSHVAMTDANSQSIKAAINVATTLAELDAIDVTAGYPAV